MLMAGAHEARHLFGVLWYRYHKTKKIYSIQHTTVKMILRYSPLIKRFFWILFSIEDLTGAHLFDAKICRTLTRSTSLFLNAEERQACNAV
jgi:hypothetical protein